MWRRWVVVMVAVVVVVVVRKCEKERVKCVKKRVEYGALWCALRHNTAHALLS